MSEQSTILVTGGTGYIGSQVVLELVGRGERVVVLDHLPWDACVSGVGGVELVQGDYGDVELVGRLLKEYGIDTILHVAAFIKVAESVAEPEKYVRNNVEHTQTLVETAAAHGVRHFIFTSTGSLYGNTDAPLIAEDHAVAPLNPYAETKIRGEEIVREYSGEDGPLRSVMLRFFNAAGADPQARTGYRLEEKPSHITRVAVRAALGDGVINVFGTDYPTPDGTCVRDYVHVCDLAQAYLCALEYLRTGGATALYNVGYGHGYSVLDIIHAVECVTGRPLDIRSKPRRTGDPASLVADSSRLRRELLWKPAHDSIDDMIRHEIAWVRAHVPSGNLSQAGSAAHHV